MHYYYFCKPNKYSENSRKDMCPSSYSFYVVGVKKNLRSYNNSEASIIIIIFSLLLVGLQGTLIALWFIRKMEENHMANFTILIVTGERKWCLVEKICFDKEKPNL